MDDPQALEDSLDDAPGCVLTRLALADLYLDLGEEAWSRYYRWSALSRTWPYYGTGGMWYFFEREDVSVNEPAPSFLPGRWCDKLGFERTLSHKGRRGIEEFLWRGIWGGGGPPQELIDRLTG